MLKALILGLGSIGCRHGRNFRALGVEIIGYDPNADRCESFQVEVQGSQTITDFDKALSSGADFAIIASPNIFHVEQSLACIRAGMHLLIEKPLATTNDLLTEFRFEAEERKQIIHMSSNWKFHPSVLKMREIVQGGEIGRVLSVQSIGGQYLPDWHPWEDYRQSYSSLTKLGGGVLNDCHDIYYVSWIVGRMTAVNCHIENTNSLEIDTTDLVNALVEFEGGVVGTMQIDYLQIPRSRRVHVTGTDGTVIWDHNKGCVEHYKNTPRVCEVHSLSPSYDMNMMYVEQSKHFLNCINNNLMPDTPIEEAFYTFHVMEAFNESSENNGIRTQIKNG